MTVPTVPSVETSAENPASWKELLTPRYYLGLIKENPAGHFLLLTAIVIGFFHGWLKLTYPGGIMVFAFDIPLMMALGVALAYGSRGSSIFPKSRTSSALQVVLGICIVYGLLPTEVPLLFRLASFRGWALVPLMYLMGYHLFNNRELLKMYGGLLLILSVITAIYGSRQDPEELRRMAEANATLETVMKGSFYGDEEGTKFRVFSTFVSAGAFGATMAYSLLIGLAQFSRKGIQLPERLLLAALMLPIAYGIFLSASRSAIIIAAISVVLIAWYRRSLLKFALPTALLLGVVLTASSMTGGSSLSRMSSAADPTALMGRVRIVVVPALNKLADNPFGGGLGRSGHGVPSVLGYLTSRFNWRPVDGDIGRVAVDFGIFGLVAFSAMFIAGTQDSLFWMKQLRGTDLDTVAVTAGAMFVTAFISFPTGSPFLAIPMGAIIWFHLGALNRLYDDRVRLTKATSGRIPAVSNILAPVPKAPQRRFMHAPQLAREIISPTLPPATTAKPKRFLFHGRGSKPGSHS